ncbi:MAG: SDR family oxidoreductase [Deltaproteobacteria bacterium]|nr:SDR family oxidoreductase [Deltaproteobacteria bacterium]MCW5806089.1 SDR family oxidoreductase [Deltaproteobacteria bacterium]
MITASSKGIGAGVAREFASRGYGVALLARGEEVHALADELDGISLRGTVDDDGALAALIAAAMGRWGRIDACVANTGHPPKGNLLALTDAQWREGFDLILASVIRLARRVAPIFAAQRSGAFVAVSSYAAARPDAARPVSSVLRAGLSAYVKLLAEELAPHGARANAVLPGFIDSQPVHPTTVATIPLGRSGSVAELARTVAWLAGDDAGFVTGQCLLVDGGMVRSL